MAHDHSQPGSSCSKPFYKFVTGNLPLTPTPPPKKKKLNTQYIEIVVFVYQMAEAGFFHAPSDRDPDIARCFVCFKELEGWEPEDNPW